jgi:hypothetical protein
MSVLLSIALMRIAVLPLTVVLLSCYCRQHRQFVRYADASPVFKVGMILRLGYDALFDDPASP